MWCKWCQKEEATNKCDVCLVSYCDSCASELDECGYDCPDAKCSGFGGVWKDLSMKKRKTDNPSVWKNTVR